MYNIKYNTDQLRGSIDFRWRLLPHNCDVFSIFFSFALHRKYLNDQNESAIHVIIIIAKMFGFNIEF